MVKKVLITGGAGLVGSHIADQLVQKGVSEIVILDNFVRGTKANLEWAIANGNVKIIEGDIRDQTLLNEIMPGVDVLFHQAAIRITQCAEEPRLALEVLVNGTYNVLEAAVKAKVKKVIAASSASVLGMAEEFPTTESHHPYNNRTFYGAAKTFNEGMLRTFNEMYGLDYIALRYFNVYGVRMDIYGVYTEVLVRWMDRIIEGKPPLIFGDGLQTMDFVSVEDIAKANILAAQSNITDEVFNIASGVETSLNDLAFSLLKVMKSDLKPEYTAERKVNPVQKRLADTSKAKKLLGFKAEVSLEEGLSRLVDWWKTTKNIV
ncbi:SDR family NAD(P)-dependent oxidoreductase [Dolichospermum sp. UHCC 0259]|uniref:SDR family NAD(P)-dependent oxidoreductase n=1 Tax=Dolichospermum sp. UHCC 0259 TaxID=2590010 RepID=UPI0014464104|nr:SDR family NAD(P)-dependent oxidoreductase [Dolichospermum sp. UHCC 0259]